MFSIGGRTYYTKMSIKSYNALDHIYTLISTYFFQLNICSLEDWIYSKKRQKVKISLRMRIFINLRPCQGSCVVLMLLYNFWVRAYKLETNNFYFFARLDVLLAPYTWSWKYAFSLSLSTCFLPLLQIPTTSLLQSRMYISQPPTIAWRWPILDLKPVVICRSLGTLNLRLHSSVHCQSKTLKIVLKQQIYGFRRY
jgi:hypothetical protein